MNIEQKLQVDIMLIKLFNDLMISHLSDYQLHPSSDLGISIESLIERYKMWGYNTNFWEEQFDYLKNNKEGNREKGYDVKR